ncbi:MULTISPECIES: glutathione S-transferase C-terminal domain-containing protein [Actinomadura]|uniref:Glutathione S-transferase n=1 Tax=Actinomadura litoris TaxID=2678616 RepID=A0A7K1L3L6_9ACTN|nr:MULTISPECIES: glutathione S-transferase C-terminal domain-containing protein [Actinomadura]MBT2210155.1 glutathione S-transferase C-terminal domain-containing protein [Actinomadura sp. NEAU-AAG7]MUN39024.1 glutathione S-transferase [Actinomadura litoris]
MSTPTAAPVYADAVDLDKHGVYGATALKVDNGGWNRPRYPFQARVTADGSSGYRAEPGRYHLYVSHRCPWAHRSAIVRILKGLEDVVSLSYVDDERDGRGWAFRERRGADPVNGFRFLREAYEATEPGYGGHVSVPVLWDRTTKGIVSNDFFNLTIDLGTQFEEFGDPTVHLYPVELRDEIDELNDHIYVNFNDGNYRVAGAASDEAYAELRGRVIATLDGLDERLATRRFLHGDAITESDVRLWVTLARFDLTYNPFCKISERRLVDFPHLWGYARDLYSRRAFRETTDLDAFTHLGPPFLDPAVSRIEVEPHRADWDEPHDRDRLAS